MNTEQDDTSDIHITIKPGITGANENHVYLSIVK